jgi:hypothetical protein
MAHPVFLCLLLQLEMEPGSKLNLTFTNDRTTSAVHHAKAVGSRLEIEVATGEGVHGRSHTCYLVAVKEIEGFSQNLEICRLREPEPT